MYTKPELLIETFDVEDVITASSGAVTPPVDPELPEEAYTTPEIPI